MTWIIKNWRILSLGFGLVALVFAYGIHRGNLIEQGYQKGVGECNAEKQVTINENINIRQKQDNVAPITGKRDLIERLRDGSAL